MLTTVIVESNLIHIIDRKRIVKPHKKIKINCFLQTNVLH